MRLDWRDEQEWEKAIRAWLGPQRLSLYSNKDIANMTKGAVIAAAILETFENKPKGDEEQNGNV
jgi:hypothetical protein